MLLHVDIMYDILTIPFEGKFMKHPQYISEILIIHFHLVLVKIYVLCIPLPMLGVKSFVDVAFCDLGLAFKYMAFLSPPTYIYFSCINFLHYTSWTYQLGMRMGRAFLA